MWDFLGDALGAVMLFATGYGLLVIGFGFGF